jgi:glutathione peroxidase-family protein
MSRIIRGKIFKNEGAKEIIVGSQARSSQDKKQAPISDEELKEERAHSYGCQFKDGKASVPEKDSHKLSNFLENETAFNKGFRPAEKYNGIGGE